MSIFIPNEQFVLHMKANIFTTKIWGHSATCCLWLNVSMSNLVGILGLSYSVDIKSSN